jgi:hypothetical protein
MARGLHSLLPAIDRRGLEAILIQNHSQSVGDDPFIVRDEHSGPGSAVGGKRFHKPLVKAKNSGVVQRVYPGGCHVEFISREVVPLPRLNRPAPRAFGD